MRPLSHRFLVYNMEKRSQMCEIHFVWSCPTWLSRWGMRISIDWPRLKSCQAICDECTRGAICSGQSRDAGMWDWPESCVTKIWGLSHDHGFVLFLFATMGFHIARSGIFWTPTSGNFKASCLVWFTLLLAFASKVIDRVKCQVDKFFAIEGFCAVSHCLGNLNDGHHCPGHPILHCPEFGVPDAHWLRNWWENLRVYVNLLAF